MLDRSGFATLTGVNFIASFSLRKLYLTQYTVPDRAAQLDLAFCSSQAGVPG